MMCLHHVWWHVLTFVQNVQKNDYDDDEQPKFTKANEWPSNSRNLSQLTSYLSSHPHQPSKFKVQVCNIQKYAYLTLNDNTARVIHPFHSNFKPIRHDTWNCFCAWAVWHVTITPSLNRMITVIIVTGAIFTI